MSENTWLFLLPILIFLFHLGLSKLNLWYLGKEAKRAVVLINMILYPMVMSGLLVLFFKLCSSGAATGLLPGWTGGIASYYLSLVLGVLPFSGPFFREMDLEFFLLGAGVVEGAQASTLKEFVSILAGQSLTHWGLLFVAILGALFLSMSTKYLVTRQMGYYDKEEEMLKGFVWGISIASGVVTIPLVLFFMAVSR